MAAKKAIPAAVRAEAAKKPPEGATKRRRSSNDSRQQGPSPAIFVPVP
jgi:hypothetical protein